MKHSGPVRARKAGAWCACLVVAALACASARAVEPTAGAGWTYAVVAEGLPAVDNLAFGAGGALYATLELVREGRLVRLTDDGRALTILGGLDRPDGLRIRGHLAYVTEEVTNGRVLEVDLVNGAVRTLARVQGPEGLAPLPDGSLLVTEDRRRGRLIRIDVDGTVETLLDSLVRPEGLARAGDGAIYLAESGTGRIVRYRGGKRDILLEGLIQPDQLAVADGGALWITEDDRAGRLLRVHEGRRETVVAGLAFPQGIALAPDGRVLVAEQGRDRVLAIVRRTP